MTDPTSVIYEPTPGRVICVLGMHRSGTSCLMGTLQNGGVELGRHRTCSPYNRRGNREDLDVVMLHEDVLNANALTWDNPVPTVHGETPAKAPELTWGSDHYERARGILRRNRQAALWGFKDPRTLLMVRQWREVFQAIEFVGIFRHPFSVAESLGDRPSFPITFDHGLELWCVYNRILLEEHRRNPFPILSFDWSNEKLVRAFDALNLRLRLRPVERGDSFFDSSLRRFDPRRHQPLSGCLAALYNQLSSISESSGF